MTVVASVEAAHYQNTPQLISLLVQELIDCDTASSWCERGYKEHAIGYIQDNGLLSESSNPYMARGSKSGCQRYKTQEAATRISGFRFVDPKEDALEKAVAKQPVGVPLQGSNELASTFFDILNFFFDVVCKSYGCFTFYFCFLQKGQNSYFKISIPSRH
jgi:hypothetical protein